MFDSAILDTLKVENGEIPYRSFHVDRTFEAYGFLGLQVSRGEIEKIYSEAARLHPNSVLRIVFANSLPVSARIEVTAFKELPSPVRLALHPLPRDFGNSAFKWEKREAWQKLPVPEGADDLLLVTPEGFYRETTRFNIFVLDTKKKLFFTPTLGTGCINGVYRRQALINGIKDVEVIERNLRPGELDYFKMYVANSVRGILPAVLI